MQDYAFGFGGRPPRLPFSRAAAALASDVTRPPLRPSDTAAGFFLGMALVDIAGNILRRQRRDTLERQFSDFNGQGLEGGVVLRGQGGITAGHQFAAFAIHALNIAKRLGFVKGHVEGSR